jgi:pimeloyl-ACP methyl ester carboxylesterase
MSMTFRLELELTPLLDCGQGIICRVMTDVFYPTDPGPWPVIVILPGGPLPLGGRANYSGFAQMLVGQGAVVFVADYRSSPSYGGGWPATFGDVACAIRFARATAAEFGGDGSRVTLVGHSFGGFPGGVVAVSGVGFESDAASCQTPAGSGAPDAFAGVAGVYTFDAIQNSFLEGFFKGSRTVVPDAWDAADLLALAQRADARDIPFRLIAGTNDGAAPVERASAVAAALASDGIDARFVSIGGADHVSIMGNAETLATILEIARPASR